MRAIFVSHVAVAFLALAVGVVAAFARKRPGLHTRSGLAYFWTVSAVNSTGAALAILDWERNAPFLAIAVSTQAFAVLGVLAARRPGRRWLIAHATGMVGSYVQIFGAFVVNNWIHLTGRHGKYSPEAFLLPGGVGTLVLVWLAVQIHRGRRPRI